MKCYFIPASDPSVLEDYIKDWGRYDWLDQAEGEIISQLDAGEIMDLLMKSESFGSNNINNSGGSNGGRMLLSIEGLAGESNEGGVSKEVMGKIVSDSGSVRAYSKRWSNEHLN